VKKVLCLLVVALLLTACGPGVPTPTPSTVTVVKEKTVVVKPVELSWLSEASVKECKDLAYWFYDETGVLVRILPTQSPDGTTMEIDGMFASGSAPDIYTAYGGRTSKYFDESIPLNIEEAKFVPGILDLCRNSKGETVAVPYQFWYQLGGINLDLVAKYGLEEYMPEPPEYTWTVAQFEAMATAFKAVCAPDEYVAMIFAASGSGDYWVQMFEVGLGAHPLYDKNGKLDVAPLGPAWAKLKEWTDKGWLPAGVEGLNDDLFVLAKMAQKLLFFGAGPYEHGTHPFRSRLVSYPSLDGSAVPGAIGPTSSIAIRTGNAEKDAAAKAFVEWLSEPEQLKVLLGTGAQYSPRVDLELVHAGSNAKGEMKALAEENTALGQAMLTKYGVMNMGIGSVKYQAIRSLRAQKMAEFFAGKPLDKALAEFQAEGDRIFAQ